jgi:hypothetical protein
VSVRHPDGFYCFSIVLEKWKKLPLSLFEERRIQVKERERETFHIMSLEVTNDESTKLDEVCL